MKNGEETKIVYNNDKSENFQAHILSYFYFTELHCEISYRKKIKKGSKVKKTSHHYDKAEHYNIDYRGTF